MKQRKSKPKAKPQHPPVSANRIGTELIRWEFVERSSRKGYLTRDFCIGRRRYRWTSNAVTRDGLMRYGILVTDNGSLQ